ncbi:Transcriptional activator NphR [compost metagenome]
MSEVFPASSGQSSSAAVDEFFFDEVDAWEAAVERSCAPLRITLKPELALKATLVEQMFGELYLGRVTSVSCQCEHNRAHISQGTDDAFLYSLQLHGEGRLIQGNRSVLIKPGDGALYDCTQPFRWEFSGDLQQLVVRLPRDLFRRYVKNAEKCTALRVDGGHGVGRLLTGHLESLLDERHAIHPASFRFMAGSTLDLLGGALSELSDQMPASGSNLQTYHLNRAYAYIAEHIRHPELSPEAIAKALGISLRYLHQLFQGTGATVARHIQEMRLDGCARELISLPAHAYSISYLAYSWGFESPAHFSRTFRNRFQMTARDYRALHSQQPERTLR